MFQAVRTGAKLKETGENDDVESYIKKILVTAGRLCPVSLEVAGLTVQEMVELGKLLYENVDPVAGNIAIKYPSVPSTRKGTASRSTVSRRSDSYPTRKYRLI